MRWALLALCLSAIISMTAQSREGVSLMEEMRLQDSIFFERSFNQCDLAYLEKHIAEDLRFYHDQGGFQDREKFLANTRQNICGGGSAKPLRKLKKGSLEVFPLYENGRLYAVIQRGIHEFFLRQSGQEDRRSSSAKFTHLWLKTQEGWILQQVYSFDHQSAENE